MSVWRQLLELHSSAQYEGAIFGIDGIVTADDDIDCIKEVDASQLKVAVLRAVSG